MHYKVNLHTQDNVGYSYYLFFSPVKQVGFSSCLPRIFSGWVHVSTINGPSLSLWNHAHGGPPDGNSSGKRHVLALQTNSSDPWLCHCSRVWKTVYPVGKWSQAGTIEWELGCRVVLQSLKLSLPLTPVPSRGLFPGTEHGEVATSAWDEDERRSGGSCQSQHIGQCSRLSAQLCPALPGRASRTRLQAHIKDLEEGMLPLICCRSRSTNFEHALPQDSLAALDCVSEWCQLNSCSKEEWLYILYVIMEHMLEWHMKSGHSLPM